ncbi:hypothetical protein N0V83_004342 [Neocucurbitaria cava]|uniref:Uncharacterized protein n=1 Tax=Neocucurbitaria cava TaxID=798079 RepID=A0A9W8Y9H2_9PLEO|nr:hypothetical protein N0V83_004342 [Neocucurbitaria cava]
MSRLDALLKGKKFGPRTASSAPAPQPSSNPETVDVSRERQIAELQKELQQLKNVNNNRVLAEDTLSEHAETLRNESATAEMIADGAKTTFDLTQAVPKALQDDTPASE